MYIYIFLRLAFFVECLSLTTKCDCAKILGIMPTASFSHQIPFHPLWRELSLRGHQVTVFTTDPMEDKSLTNLTEIHMNYLYDFFEKVKFYETLGDDTIHFWDRGKYLQKVTIDLTYFLLQSENVKKFLRSGEKFDLVIAEAQFPAILGLIGNFRCPWIGVSSLEPALHVHFAIGNPSHPVLNPDPNLEIEDPDNPCFLERVLSFIYRSAYAYEFNTNLLPILTDIHKGMFEDLPPLTEVLKNVSMLFSVTSPIFHNLRAVYPNTIALGSGMHFLKPKPLPEPFPGRYTETSYLTNYELSFFCSKWDDNTVIGNEGVVDYTDTTIILIKYSLANIAIPLRLANQKQRGILAIIPTASYSHQSPFQPLWTELALRGHEVTVMTTDPQKNESLANLREIDMSYTYDIYRKHGVSDLLSNDSKSFLEIGNALGVIFKEAQHAQLSLPEVQELINNKKNHFDLLIVEAQTPGMLAFAWRFQCPIIAVASLDCAMQYHDTMGNPIHPVLNPDYNLNVGDADDMSFIERLLSALYISAYKYFIYSATFHRQHETAKQYFGNDLPPLIGIQNNISMVFVGTHPIFHNLRPLNLNTITLGGGMHLKQPKPLPEDLKTFLDGAKDGVIYFSLGSNVKSKTMPDDLRKAIIGAFAQIPLKVLLKIDGDLEGLSENVLVRKWMPQQDILRHPNIKLFITQGGLQSLQEAVVNNIPLIGIPFFGDQITNVNKMVKRGYGVKLDKRKISKDILLSAINEVIENPKYREKAKEMGDIFRDEEIPSLQRAVYWTEYVIRTKGARHLRSPAASMPTWKYYMLDVIACLVLAVVLIIFGCLLLVKLVFRIILGICQRKSKSKKKLH